MARDLRASRASHPLRRLCASAPSSSARSLRIPRPTSNPVEEHRAPGTGSRAQGRQGLEDCDRSCLTDCDAAARATA